MGNFNVQALANTAWSFAKASQLNAQLFRLLRGVAEQHVRDFDVQHVGMTLWALLRHESLKDAWGLFDHAKRIGVSFGPLCFGALVMECEQR